MVKASFTITCMSSRTDSKYRGDRPGHQSSVVKSQSFAIILRFLSFLMISISSLVLILATMETLSRTVGNVEFPIAPLFRSPCLLVIINQTLLYDEHLQNSSESPFVNRPILPNIPFGTTALIVQFYFFCVHKSSVLGVNRCLYPVVPLILLVACSVQILST